jgi:hypothetical protein
MSQTPVLRLLLGAASLAIAGCESAEIAERYYANYDELRAANEPGNWVPAFIPRLAVDIHVKYKIDTGAQILAFSVEDRQALSVEGHCAEASASELEGPPSKLSSAEWWPEVLSGESAQLRELRGYQFYRCERRSFLAVSTAPSGRTFYWRTSLR